MPRKTRYYLPIAGYVYNGQGERVEKTASLTTLYYFDQDGRLLAELDGGGGTRREYVYLNGRPLALLENGSRYFMHDDHLGTPQVITDAGQQVVWEADYRPFGQAAVTTGSITNNLRFPGQYFDSETGLHYNLNRYLDPSLGRYTQSDLIGLDGGLNTYTYVSNNPINFIDPLGLIEWKGSGTIGTAAFFVGAGGGFFNLTSECVDGKQGEIKVIAVGPGVGFGGKGSITASNLVFEDGKSNIDPSGFNGEFFIAVAGAARGPGISFSGITLGDAESVGFSFDAGVAFGVFEGGGSSTVISSNIKNCTCGN